MCVTVVLIAPFALKEIKLFLDQTIGVKPAETVTSFRFMEVAGKISSTFMELHLFVFPKPFFNIFLSVLRFAKEPPQC